MKTCEKEFPEFVSEVNSLTAEQLKARVVQLQQTLQESEQHKEENDALKSAREELSMLIAPYRDVKKAVRLKTEFILKLLQNLPQK